MAQTLSLQFVSRGTSYRQIWRSKRYAIYETIGSASDVHYEVIRVLKYKKDFYGKTAGDEYYPSDKDWGKDGWTYITLESAKDKMRSLDNRIVFEGYNGKLVAKTVKV